MGGRFPPAAATIPGRACKLVRSRELSRGPVRAHGRQGNGVGDRRRGMESYGNFEGAALNELVAQLVEQRPFKAWVLGSSPSELTISAAANPTSLERTFRLLFCA